MKITEITYTFEDVIDVQRDAQRRLKNAIIQRQTTLETVQSSQQIDNFLSVLSAYDISQSELKVGSLYCPIDFSYDENHRLLDLSIVIKPAEYVGEQGSRLLFKYQNSDKILQFPADGYTAVGERRIVCENKPQLDTIVQQFVLQFGNDQWVYGIFGYNEAGSVQRINL